MFTRPIIFLLHLSLQPQKEPNTRVLMAPFVFVESVSVVNIVWSLDRN